MRRVTESGENCLTVPARKSIAKGTPDDILTRGSLSTGLPSQDLLSRLAGTRRPIQIPGRAPEVAAGRVFREDG